MNHEHESHEQLPTIEGLFHRAGELAVLHGRIEDTDNENETLRQFILDDFPKATKQKWPQLREITYTPSYMIDYAPSGDMVWITLADAEVESVFMLSQRESDTYVIEIERSAAEKYASPSVSQEQIAATDIAIHALFGDGTIDTERVANQAENIDFLLTHDTTPTPTDILLLDDIITSLDAEYPHR